jgi:hypothetical protein
MLGLLPKIGGFGPFTFDRANNLHVLVDNYILVTLRRNALDRIDLTTLSESNHNLVTVVNGFPQTPQIYLTGSGLTYGRDKYGYELWRVSPTASSIVVDANGSVPGFGSAVKLKRPLEIMAASEQVLVFSAQLAGPGGLNDDCLWVERDKKITMLAQVGGASSGHPWQIRIATYLEASCSGRYRWDRIYCRINRRTRSVVGYNG